MVRVPDGGDVDRSVESIVAAAIAVVSGGAIADNQHDSVPAGVAAIGEIPRNYQQAVARVVSSHAEVTVNYDRHRIRRGHSRRHIRLVALPLITRSAALVMACTVL